MEIQNKHHNGNIYQNADIGYNKCYIRSTTAGLSLRMTRHRAGYKHFLNSGKKFMSSFELFKEYGIENCKVELIEYCPCDTLQELQRKEGEHIKSIECVNKYVAGRTRNEYKESNKKNKMLERDKKYREQNKDKIKERDKEYYANNKNKKKEYKKNWYEQNKDKTNDHHKSYYQTNKDKINEKRREIYKLKKESDKVENTE